MNKGSRPELKEGRIAVRVDLLKDRTARQEYLKFQEEYMEKINKRYRKRRELEHKAQQKWKGFLIRY